MLIGIVLILIFPDPVLAGEPPALITPENNSTVSQSKLTWQAPSYPLYQTNPYRIQVDDNSDFSSINKDYYTKNAYYTPSLSEGIWFWKVKVKDSTGVWSDWSNIWQFTLSSAQESPSPEPAAIPTPIPTAPSPISSPSPTPSPIPSPSPTPKPSSISTPTPASSVSKTKTTNPALSPTPKPSSFTSPSFQPKPSSTSLSSVKPSKNVVKIDYKIASVAGESTSDKEATRSEKINQKENKKPNLFIISGVTLISVGITFLGYLVLKIKGF